MIADFSPSQKLAHVLGLEQGCRIGETAVVSRKVHTITPLSPDTVYVMRDADAGRVFYRRPTANEVLHVDVFHSLAQVSPAAIAKAVCRAVENYGRAVQADCRELAHYIDLQTAAGGGRATGRLTFGQRDTLKQAHKNHVHLTLLLAGRDLALTFFLVEEVERALIADGAELRKIEHVVHSQSDASLKRDLSPYMSSSDSFLMSAKPVKDERTKAEAYTEQLTHLADILEELEDIDELRHLLYTTHPAVNSKGVSAFQARLGETWSKLRGYGYLECRGERYLLSGKGMRLYDSVAYAARQIECDLKYYHRLGRQATISASKHGYGRVHCHKRARRGYHPRPRLTEGERTLAVIPTISLSLHDAYREQSPWLVKEQHLRFEAKTTRQRLDICLLIDASASMMGRRIKAAKALAEQLVHATDDRLAVVYFQEDRVEVAVPFTRNQLLLKSGLKSIKPSGLTPLALGLLTASRYVSTYSCRERSLLIVITDGIPTMALAAGDPMEEVLQQARDIGRRRIRLCCVGLQPNHRLLSRLAETAGGSVHIIDEITAPMLLSIVKQERRAALTF